jgi:hypothetical protein
MHQLGVATLVTHSVLAHHDLTDGLPEDLMVWTFLEECNR